MPGPAKSASSVCCKPFTLLRARADNNGAAFSGVKGARIARCATALRAAPDSRASAALWQGLARAGDACPPCAARALASCSGLLGSSAGFKLTAAGKSGDRASESVPTAASPVSRLMKQAGRRVTAGAASARRSTRPRHRQRVPGTRAHAVRQLAQADEPSVSSIRRLPPRSW